MKYFNKILLVLLIFLVYQAPVFSRDLITDWYVKNLETSIIVNSDSSIDITENILADCGNLPDKHGIYRVLPKKYKTTSETFNIPTNLISITHNNVKANYLTSSDRETTTYQIGDSNITVHGENLYQIKYHVKNTIRTPNENFDELYWNVLGSYWDLEIDNFIATITFPPEINEDNTQISLYAGYLNSKNENLASYRWTDHNTLEIKGGQKFLRNQGVTLSASFPKDIIKPYQATFEEKYGFSVFDIIIFFLLILTSLIVGFHYKKKLSNGFNKNKVVIPEFEIPENLTPIEMGAIIKKGELDKNSIAATIVHLGFLGYIKIERVEKKILFFDKSEFKIIRTNKKEDENLDELEAYILSLIFRTTQEVNLSNIGLTISKYFTTITEKQLSFLNSKKYINNKLKKQKNTAIGVSIFIGSSSLILAFSLNYIPLCGLAIASGIIFLFSKSLSFLTAEGEEINWRLRGFKLYMETAEKYRSKFQEKNDILDKLLPYAILFGITTEWLSKMKDIYGEEYLNNYSPSFMSRGIGLVGFNSFIDNMSNISNGVASSISKNTSSSSSGFGGGGSSGGGGGGGGGGGW
jgi:uncharacterized membrane protein